MLSREQIKITSTPELRRELTKAQNYKYPLKTHQQVWRDYIHALKIELSKRSSNESSI